MIYLIATIVFFANSAAMETAKKRKLTTNDHVIQSDSFSSYLGEFPVGFKTLKKILENTEQAENNKIMIPQVIEICGPAKSGKSLLIESLAKRMSAKIIIQNTEFITDALSNVTMRDNLAVIKERLIYLWNNAINDENHPFFFIFEKSHLFFNDVDATVMLKFVDQLKRFLTVHRNVYFYLETRKCLPPKVCLEISDQIYHRITVSLPDEQQQIVLWQHFLKQAGLQILDESQLIKSLVNKSKNFAACEIQQVCQQAARQRYGADICNETLYQELICDCLEDYIAIRKEPSDASNKDVTNHMYS